MRPLLEIVITREARDLLFGDEKQIPPRAKAVVVMTNKKGCGIYSLATTNAAVDP
jgi:hypothetical protein